MSSFTKMQKKYMWPEIIELISSQTGEEESLKILSRARSIAEDNSARYKDLKGFEKTHVCAAVNIASIYIPVRDSIGTDKALEVFDTVWKPSALKSCAKYDKYPPKMFIGICRVVAKNAFGNKAGFVREDVSGNKNEVRFNITSCPYVNIMKAMGCEEACPVVCRQDEYTYGGLSGIAFERTKTLGRGDDMCDFCYRLKD